MSIVAVLEIIGKGIDELKRENHMLKIELNDARKDGELWRKAYTDAKDKQDELQSKLEAVQQYADSLAPECENVSKTEEIKESGC